MSNSALKDRRPLYTRMDISIQDSMEENHPDLALVWRDLAGMTQSGE